MNDTLKRIAYHRIAPHGLILLAAVAVYLSGLENYLFLVAVAVAVVGGYFQVGFGTLPRKKANLRVLH